MFGYVAARRMREDDQKRYRARKGRAMTRDSFVEQIERNAKVINAMHYARYALVRHHMLPVTVEGQQFRMDFSLEIEKLTEAMELLGVDISRGLLAPPFSKPDADDG
jgi:hypothetical protein